MIRFDCMTVEELAEWRAAAANPRSKAGSPCVDCPLEFHLAESAAGRCNKVWPSRGRPREYVMDWHERRAKAARNRAYRAELRSQVEAVRVARAREQAYNTVVGVSDVSATMRDDAALGAYSTESRVVAFPPGVRR